MQSAPREVQGLLGRPSAAVTTLKRCLTSVSAGIMLVELNAELYRCLAKMATAAINDRVGGSEIFGVFVPYEYGKWRS